jgi:hypothetical protein
MDVTEQSRQLWQLWKCLMKAKRPSAKWLRERSINGEDTV